MRRFFYSLLLLTGVLVAFVGYCTALINWLQAYSSGYYAHHRLEQVVESVAIVIYTYLGVRFCRRKVDGLL